MTEPITAPKLRFLGWLNDGPDAERDALINKCQSLKHETKHFCPPGNRSGAHTVQCLTCNYEYRYDTSD